MQLHQTILKALGGLQFQRHVSVPPRYQGNAITYEHWNHTDHELVDRLLVEEGGDEITAAHQPEVLPGLLSETAHEWADGAVHELHALRDIWRRRMAGENDGPVLRVELRPQPQTRLVGLPAKDLRVNRFREGGHTVEPGGGGAGRQPAEITVRARDKAVGTGSDVHDDASALRHGLALRQVRPLVR
jgi:hypothetical protein